MRSPAANPAGPYPPLSLYVHIPWCVRKCPYCDFNSHEAKIALPENAYVDALVRDLKRDIDSVPDRIIESIFIGGGTPSLMSARMIGDLLENIHRLLSVSAEAEITLEANPGTVEKKRFRGFRAAGINRLSIGIQSFNNRHLNALGRIHSADEAAAAARGARESGLENINLDLMYGLPEQSVEEAGTDIQTAVSLSPAHISCYQLTLEPQTRFYRFPPALPAHDKLWDIQSGCHRILKDNGFEQYEISAFCRTGLECRHNLNYWNYGDYLGIGAGAHGKISSAGATGIRRYSKVRNPDRFIRLAGSEECLATNTQVSNSERPLEFLMNTLRLHQGFPVSLYRERTGLDPDLLYPALAEFVDRGLVDTSNDTVRCTRNGQNFLDEILTAFAAG